MLFKLIQVELLKTKRSLALLMMFLCPLMVVFVNLLLFINSDGKIVNEKGWGTFWLTNYGMWGYFMMPLYIALITALLNGVEHKSNGWRYMTTLPINPKQIFVAKFILAWAYLIGASLILFTSIFFVILALNSFGYTGGELISITIFEKIIYACVASLAILMIQHIVSWRWQNIVAPLGLGVLATFSVMQFSSSKYWFINPWTYTLMTTNASNMSNQNNALIYSLFLTICLLVIGMFWLGRREVTC